LEAPRAYKCKQILGLCQFYRFSAFIQKKLYFMSTYSN